MSSDCGPGKCYVTLRNAQRETWRPPSRCVSGMVPDHAFLYPISSFPHLRAEQVTNRTNVGKHQRAKWNKNVCVSNPRASKALPRCFNTTRKLWEIQAHRLLISNIKTPHRMGQNEPFSNVSTSFRFHWEEGILIRALLLNVF